MDRRAGTRGGNTVYITGQSGPQANKLSAVTCVSASRCIAVGYSGLALQGSRPLIEETTSSGWRVVPSGDPHSQVGSELTGVACAGPELCVAVGNVMANATVSNTLIEEDSGSGWSITSSPNLTASYDSGGRLNGVACPTANLCVAVGSYIDGPQLIEERTSGRWSVVPSPSADTGGSALSGVSCVSETTCFAVGDQALIEERTPGGWRAMAAHGSVLLSDVSCAGPNFCVTVASVGDGVRPGVREYTGDGWIPIASTPTGGMFAVACPAPRVCLVAGGVMSGPVGGDPVILRRTPAGWDSLPTLDLKHFAELDGVACATGDHCFLVGWQSRLNSPDYDPRTQPSSTALIIEYDGGDVKVLDSPLILP